MEKNNAQDLNDKQTTTSNNIDTPDSCEYL